MLLRTAGKGTGGAAGAISRGERCALFFGLVNVVEDPLLLPSNVW